VNKDFQWAISASAADHTFLSAISALNEAIEALNPAKISSIPLTAKAVFGSVRTLLTLIRVCLLFFYNSPPQVHT